ncbi:MAG: hypothetical protein ACYTGB_16835 [Planctomycetota bacterium]|jgi:hypothetical protein
MPEKLPMTAEELPAELRPVVHSESLPDDEFFAVGEHPPAGPFEAAGFRVLEAQWDNRAGLQSRFPCAWADSGNARLAAFRERYDFAAAMEGASSEFERLLLLRRWVSRQIPSGRPVRWTPDAFEVLGRAAAGGTFQCTHFAKVLQACCVAGGWLARHVGVGSFHTPDQIANHHGVMDVWVNELGKWVLFDAHYDVHYEKKGVPLSPFEIGREYHRNGGADVDVCAGPAREKVERTVVGETTVAGAHESSRYFWNLHRWSFTDPFSLTVARIPQQLMLVQVGERHENQVWHQGGAPNRNRRLHVGYVNSYFQFTRRPADVYPEMGTCRLEIAPAGVPGAVTVKVGTHTPNFDVILAAVDGGPLRPAAARQEWLHHKGEYLPELHFEWFLHEGENRLAVRTRNRFGLRGTPSSVRVVLAEGD